MDDRHYGVRDWDRFDRKIGDEFLERIMNAIERWGTILKIVIEPKHPHSVDHDKRLLFIVKFKSPLKSRETREDRFLDLYHSAWLHVWDTPFRIEHLSFESFEYDNDVQKIVQFEGSREDMIVFWLDNVCDIPMSFSMDAQNVLYSLEFVPDKDLQIFKDKSHLYGTGNIYRGFKNYDNYDKLKSLFLSQEGVDKLKDRYIEWIENSGKAMLEHGISLGRLDPRRISIDKYLEMEETTRLKE